MLTIKNIFFLIALMLAGTPTFLNAKEKESKKTNHRKSPTKNSKEVEKAKKEVEKKQLALANATTKQVQAFNAHLSALEEADDVDLTEAERKNVAALQKNYVAATAEMMTARKQALAAQKAYQAGLNANKNK